MLYCITLHYIILYYTILYNIILYHISGSAQLLHSRGVALMDEPGGRGRGAEVRALLLLVLTLLS